MRTEMPEMKRACFCFPLRYGLLLWGYFRWAFALIVLLTYLKSWTEGDHIFSNIYMEIAQSTLIVLDIILAIMFIIGAHKKSIKLMKIFYFYDLGLLILEILIYTGMLITICVVVIIHRPNLFSTTTWIILVYSSTVATSLIIRGYFLLLVRSEIIKLSNNCQFRFVNNAAETECTTKCKITGDGELELEKNIEETLEAKENGLENMDNLTNVSEGNLKYKKLDVQQLQSENTSELSSKCNMKYKKLGD